MMSVHGMVMVREYGAVICCNDYDYVIDINTHPTTRSGSGFCQT
jgi:hypothetical protein